MVRALKHFLRTYVVLSALAILGFSARAHAAALTRPMVSAHTRKASLISSTAKAVATAASKTWNGPLLGGNFKIAKRAVLALGVVAGADELLSRNSSTYRKAQDTVQTHIQKFTATDDFKIASLVGAQLGVCWGVFTLVFKQQEMAQMAQSPAQRETIAAAHQKLYSWLNQGFGTVATVGLGALLAKHYGYTRSDSLVPPKKTLKDGLGLETVTQFNRLVKIVSELKQFPAPSQRLELLKQLPSCLIVSGPSGGGNTYAANCLTATLDVPVVTAVESEAQGTGEYSFHKGIVRYLNKKFDEAFALAKSSPARVAVLRIDDADSFFGSDTYRILGNKYRDIYSESIQALRVFKEKFNLMAEVHNSANDPRVIVLMSSSKQDLMPLDLIQHTRGWYIKDFNHATTSNMDSVLEEALLHLPFGKYEFHNDPVKRHKSIQFITGNIHKGGFKTLLSLIEKIQMEFLDIDCLETNPEEPVLTDARLHEIVSKAMRYASKYVMRIKSDQIPLEQVVGVDKKLKTKLNRIVTLAQYARWLKLEEPLKGMLMYGAPGLGKTFLLEAMAKSLQDLPNGGVACLSVSVAQMKTAQDVVDIFEEAQESARSNSNYKTVVLILDEIESLAANRDMYGANDAINTALQYLQ